MILRRASVEKQEEQTAASASASVDDAEPVPTGLLNSMHGQTDVEAVVEEDRKAERKKGVKQAHFLRSYCYK